MTKISFELEGFDRFDAWVKSLTSTQLAKMNDRIARSAGLRVLEVSADSTPVRTGRLRASLGMGHVDNVFKTSNATATTAEVTVGTNVDYAKHVNDGFTQRRGQFVPGEWKSGTFHYIPYTPGSGSGGMVLTGKTVAGAHYMEKAIDALQEDLPKIVEFELKRLYQELKGGS